MRIIYLHQYFSTPSMVGGTRSFEVGRRLVAAGHEVNVVTSWRESSEATDWFISDEAGIRVHWMPVPYSNHMTYGSRIAAFTRFAIGAAQRATSLDGDVIFATSTPLTIALPAVYAARRKRIPMVFEVRDLWPEIPIAIGALKNPVSRWAARLLEKFAYSNSAHVVALSPGMAEGVARVGYPPERITIVPNSSDLDLFRRDIALGREFRRKLGIADDKIVVGYAGTLGKVNAAGYLVRVAAALKADNRFVFVMIGDGLERDQIKALAREHAVLDRSFFMLSKVAKCEMPAVLSGFDIATSLFVSIPELETNSANKFFDALAAGCCVMINYGGWQADLLQEGDAGIRLAYDPERGAAELQALANISGRIEMQGLNARRLAEERFSRDVLAARIEKVVAQTVTEGGWNAGR